MKEKQKQKKVENTRENNHPRAKEDEDVTVFFTYHGYHGMKSLKVNYVV